MRAVPFKTSATLQKVIARFERFTRAIVALAPKESPQLAVFIRNFWSRARFVWMQCGMHDQ